MFKYLFNLYKKNKFNKMLICIKNNINIDKSTILMPSIHFDFRSKIDEIRILIGKNSMIGCNFIFESDEGFIKIGDRTFINGGTNLISRSKIEIGNDVTIGWGCYIYDHNSHSLDWQHRSKDVKQQRMDYTSCNNFTTNKDWSNVKSKPIKICDKSWIGFDAVILKGVTIGEGAIIGARSVVTKDVEPWTVVAGNPARFIKNIEH